MKDLNGLTGLKTKRWSRLRTAFLALLLAIAIGSAGLLPALAQGKFGQPTNTRLSTSLIPNRICVGQTVSVNVTVKRGVEFASGKAVAFERPGISINASVEDASIVSLLGEAELSDLSGGTEFEFQGKKEGSTTLVFNAIVTLVQGELAIGSSPSEPNKAETRVRVIVEQCDFEVTVLSVFKVPNLQVVAKINKAVLSADAQGQYTGRAEVTNGGYWIDTSGYCGHYFEGSSFTIADLTGAINDKGFLVMKISYEESRYTWHTACLPEIKDDDVTEPFNPSPLEVSVNVSAPQEKRLYQAIEYLGGEAFIIVVPFNTGQ